MVRLQDEPIGDPVCVPVFYVSKLARDNGVIVCQVGEGADELFCGYPAWKQYLRLQHLDDMPVPRAVKRLGVWAASHIGAGERRETELLRRGAAGLPVFWSGADAFGENQKRRLLSSRLRRSAKDLTSWDAVKPIRQRFDDGASERSALNWMTYCDLNLRLPELLLMRVDKMSMGVSLEGRVPFLDHRFVGLALSIPTAAKTRDGELKHLLKLAVRGVIPDAIIDRPKQGFGVPVHEWFFDRLGGVARSELERFCRDADLLHFTEIERYLETGRGSDVWFLLNLALWWRQAIAGEPALVSAP
jgi:asparagine synthase (glutamine-hydrolysing)